MTPPPIESVPGHWRIRPLARLRLRLKLIRKNRRAGVVVVARFHFWANRDGPYVGSAARVTVDGRSRTLGTAVDSPKFFDSKHASRAYHQIELHAPGGRFELEVPVLEAPGKYLMYVEPERKDGTPAIVEIRRIV